MMNHDQLTRSIGGAALAAALVMTACSKGEPDRPTAGPTAAIAATAATAAAMALPTPEDYEASATTTVTADSLDAQLDALEKEIAATPR